MHPTGLAVPVLIFSGFFLLATCSAVLLKKLRFPYTIGLVIIGMVLGLLAKNTHFLEPVLQAKLTHDLIMYVLLPVLIFDAAINIKLPALVRVLAPVLMLAIVGVVLSMLVVAAIMDRFSPLSLMGALLFGALISATDPVAVIALFKEIGAPERMSLLMDAESLFNDATAIVLFGIVLSICQTGVTFNAGMVLASLLEFCRVFLGGILLGAVLGFLMLGLLKTARKIPFVQMAHTTILAFGSFIIADHCLGMSGVMATIAAGVVIRTWSGKVLSAPVQKFLYPYWEFVAFVANSLIFLMLGMKEDVLFRNLDRLQAVFPYMLVAVAAVLLGRFLVVYLLVPLSNQLPWSHPVDGKTRVVMFWGGLRGVVPVALMLSIPVSMPERNLIIDLTLAVILFSLLVQGTTIEWLMKRLGVSQKYHVSKPSVTRS
ncbi:MAG: cation:proton antiporter [Endozoicomonas sp.]